MTSLTSTDHEKPQLDRVAIHSAVDNGVSQLALPIALLLCVSLILLGFQRAIQDHDYTVLWWSPVAVIGAGFAVLMARGGVLEVFVVPEGLEFRSGGDVRCFPWATIREISPRQGYGTTSSTSRAFRVTLVSGSTLDFIGRLDALERIEAMPRHRDEPWQFEV